MAVLVKPNYSADSFTHSLGHDPWRLVANQAPLQNPGRFSGLILTPAGRGNQQSVESRKSWSCDPPPEAFGVRFIAAPCSLGDLLDCLLQRQDHWLPNVQSGYKRIRTCREIRAADEPLIALFDRVP
jgi:hypothetical protein